MFNRKNGTLYTGVTNDIRRRVYEHKNKTYKNSFTAKYNCNKLAYYENFKYVNDALEREKKLKSGSRAQKIKLIESINPNWLDLSEQDKALHKCPPIYLILADRYGIRAVTINGEVI